VANFRDRPYSFNDIQAVSHSETKLDLSDDMLFELQIKDGNLFYKVRYNMHAINLSLLEDFISCYKELYKDILLDLLEAGKGGQPTLINHFKILTEKQYQKLVYDWNKTERPSPQQKTMHALFEKQVKERPQNIAFINESYRLNYQELNEKANRLAHYFINHCDIKPDSLIALCLDKSEYTFVAMLAVLKSGAAYVPIDPNSPDERIKYILKDTKAKLLLTNETHQKRLERIKEIDLKIFCIGSIELEVELQCQSLDNPTNSCIGTDLAYVIYTSGTTGKPKGVMIEHKGVVNLLSWYKNEFQLTENDVSCQFASFGFDVFVCETFPFLISGGTVIFINEDVKGNPLQLLNWLDTNKVTFCELPVSLGAVVLEEDFPKTLSLRILKIGGEKVKNLPNKPFPFDIVNIYGPTEVSVDSLFARLYSASPVSIHHYPNMIAPPIGKPIHNLQVYVVDKRTQLLPVGAIGEICVSGVGVGRGYLNNSQLTREKFVENPFSSDKNNRLYKTGDLGRFLPDGNVEYIGRTDSQIKIRGYRVELGEIESALCSYKCIQESVVLVKEGNNANKYLVAYYMSTSPLDKEGIFLHLRSILPEYMIPTMLVHLFTFPLTINGKIDKKALPDSLLTDTKDYTPPRNGLETKLCAIWAETLGLPSEKISIKADFFSLGGNSILAIRLISKINKDLNINVGVSGIFKENSIQKLAQLLEHDKQKQVVIKKFEVTMVENQLLSFSQEKLWFVERYEEGTHAYNVPLVFKLCQGTKLDILKQTLQSIVKRHEVLRTLIKEGKQGGYQFVLDEELRVRDIEVHDKNELDKELSKEMNHIYNLESEIPIKVCFYKVENEYYISIVIHHIAFDGWSVDVFLRELQEYYQYYNKESDLNMPILSIQYKDFSLWQRNYLSGERLKKQLVFWKGKLEGYNNLSLIADKQRSNRFNYAGEDLYFTIDEETSSSLRALARELEVSLYSVLLSAYYLMLRSYSNQDDIIVGTSLANRHYTQIENLIGFFVNSLALRTVVEPNILLKSFIQKIGRETIEVQLHQDIPFGKLVEELAIEKDTSRHPIFQVVFGVQSFGNDQVSFGNILQPYMDANKLYKVAKFDVSLFIDDSKQTLMGNFNYAVSLYTEKTIQSFIDTYITLLKQITSLSANKERQDYLKIVDLNYINSEEYQKIIYNWNNTDLNYSDKETIQALFEKQVKRVPGNIAVVYENCSLTYQEVNEKANKLAHYFINNYGIKPDVLIALFLDRSEYMLIAILAVLKAGGAYVPIDPGSPEERFQYILKDTNAKVILTNKHHQVRLEGCVDLEVKVLSIDSIVLETELQFYSSENPTIFCLSTNLAYVIYTSGTSGQPKGVMIEHGSVINYTDNIINRFSVTQYDKCLMISDYNFDLGYTSLFGAIFLGGELNIISKNSVLSLDSMINYIHDKKISVIKTTPLYFKSLIDYCEQNPLKICRNSIKIILGGEKLTSDILDFLSNKYEYNQVLLYNHYGPTETTIGCVSCIVNYNDPKIRDLYHRHSAIGYPFNNIQAYVLNSMLKPLPVGAIGELYIGGAGLARGYLNKADLTVEKFIPNPFQTEEDKSSNRNAVLYKTGDLVRWLEEKKLEYIGRNDFQVKIRGYRIELGEIEATLLKHQDVLQAVVITKQEFNNIKLIAYFVPKEFIPSATELKEFLEITLPDYMIPSSFVNLEKLPLTANGKLDRRSLPDPGLNNLNNYVPPANLLEDKLCQIWAETLNINQDKVGANDDFFHLGGDSILAIRLVSKINKELSTQVKVRNIFEQKTISALAKIIDGKIENEIPYIPFSLVNIQEYESVLPDLKLVEDIYPASYLQMGMLLESNLNDKNTYKNILGYLIKAKFIEAKFIKTWEDLIEKHELLRASFSLSSKHGWTVCIHKTAQLNCEMYYGQDTESLINKERNSGFSYNNDALFKLIVNVLDDNYDLIVIFHHAIQDGWSMASLMNEFIQSYVYEQIIFPNLNLRYGEFVKNELLAINNGENVEFWKRYLEDLNITRVRWKFNNIKSQNAIFDFSFHLTAEEVQKVHRLSKRNSVSLDSIFLLAYIKTLAYFTNNEDIVIGLVVNNRLEKESGDKILGLFLNTVPFRYKLNNKNDLLGIFNAKLELFKFKHLPYGYIKSLMKQDLYDFAFNFVHFHVLENSNSNIKYIGGYERTSIPFTLNVAQENNKGFYVDIVVHDDYIDKDYLKYFSMYYRECLSKMLDHAEGSCSLTEVDYDKIINVWNQTEKKYPDNKVIQTLFEEQVKKTPHSIAVVSEDNNLTYSELNAKANKLANYLIQNYNIETESLVAICIDRSEHLLISILAVLKAGGAYIPIDPSYPDQRIKYILDDSAPRVTIVNKSYRNRLEDLTISKKIVTIDSVELDERLISQNSGNLPIRSFANNLAYIIYTSGTTGSPKGVMIEHKGVVNYIFNIRQFISLSSEDKVDFSTNIGFDLTITTTICALCLGSQVIIYENQLQELDAYQDNLIKKNINVIKLVPSYFELLIDFLPNTKISKVILGGEKLNAGIIEKLCNIYAKLKKPLDMIIYDEYGPTEATVGTCINQVYPGRNLTIGKPYNNYKVYVLDLNLAPLPIGVIGELYIGGPGLARGYLNQPELTASKFIDNPFQKEQEKRTNENRKLYKTGDLVRWLPDGNLEYIGRDDFQVKIKGFRIELEEIEKTLSNYKEITNSIVLVKENKELNESSSSNKYLVGYYVSKEQLKDVEILSYLHMRLPEYMIPAILVHMERLPLTVNGKLDRKALPQVEFSGRENFLSPRNELERKLCGIWAEVLGLSISEVGILDDFFMLGGDSIVSIRLVSRLRQSLNLNVSVKDIFNYKTIARLHENVLSKGQAGPIQFRTEQGILSGELPLLPIQKWFFESNFLVGHHWNQSFIVKTPRLNVEKLQESIRILVEHHDGFRLRFRKAKGNHIQYYDLETKLENLKVLDIRTVKDKESCKEFENKLHEILTSWQSCFDLESGPLYSIGYLEGYEDGSARLYFALHHLIIDAVSWRILVEDLKNIYDQKALGLKGSSYRQWANAIISYSNKYEQEKAYWENVLLNYKENQLISLALEAETHAEFSLNSEQTRQLLRDCQQAYHTQVNDLLLTALGYALSSITGDKLNFIVLEGHGREEIGENLDISRTLGWFTTLYPIGLMTDEEIGMSIKTNKENLRRVPNKGVGYGALIGYQRTLPRIIFNYLGQFDKEEDNLSENWRIIKESSWDAVHSANQDLNIINLNGLVIEGTLHFNIISKLGRDYTKQIANLFKEKLLMVINHTFSETRSHLTESDVGNIINKDYLDKLQATKEIESIYLANSLQQGFIYHALNQASIDDAYLVQLVWEYNSQLEVDLLKEAWNYAQQKFSCLRLRLAWEEELIQVIDKEGSLDWRYIDLSNKAEKDQEFNIQDILEKDRAEPFILEQGCLFRIYLIKMRNELFTCVFSNHHAILDGWSVPILFGYVHEVYLKLKDRTPILLIKDHSYEVTQSYLQEHKDDHEEYWDKYVEQIEEQVDLSGLLISKYKQIRLSQYKHIKMPKEKSLAICGLLYNKLKSVSQREGVTLNAILQFVWHKVLSIYGNTHQTVLGMTISGRNLPVDNIESSVGLYINTLPLIVSHKEQMNMSLIAAIKSIQDNINEINSKSGISLAKLQKRGERLFDCLFVYENYPSLSYKGETARLKVKFRKVVEKLDYPLCVIVHEENNEIIFKIRFAGELFRHDGIDQLLSTTRVLLEQLVDNSIQTVKNLRYLTSEQYQEMIVVWNQVEKTYPSHKTIHALFEEQNEKTPNNIALIYSDIRLTYQELNERANELAHYLRNEHVIKPDSLIALCLDRSEHVLIAILAVLKAGGAYVPIDPAYPDEIVKYILEDSNAKVILTNEVYRSRMNNINQEKVNSSSSNHIKKCKKTDIVVTDSERLQKLLSSYSKSNPGVATKSTNLAYVIYTSGTTGNPKGVLQLHGNVMRLFTATNDWYKFNSSDVWILFHSYVFDFSVWEMWGALIYGAKLVLPSYEQTRDVNMFYELCDQAQVTVLNQTPTLFYQFADIATVQNKKRKLKSLRYIIFGGEALNLSQLKNWFDYYGSNQPQLINMYGITETTVHVTYKLIKEQDLEESADIGIIIPDLTAYVLDSNQSPLPIGAVGELYIGGAGLARGYLRKPELTKQRFIDNPFQIKKDKKAHKNSTLYKTGDLVRWLPKGNLEYIGRNDFQVKIRGYRIELGAIESALSTYVGIRRSVVLAKEYKNRERGVVAEKYLVGYYVSDHKLNEEDIHNYLQLKLPEYMVPTRLIYLDKLPLTINGKLDRKGLPEPHLIGTETYIPPRNKLETKLCEIWAETLGLSSEKISIKDNFFRLGGNSILAIRLISKINKNLNINVGVSGIFKENSIEKLARLLERAKQGQEVIKKFEVTEVESQLLSFSQERLWFIERYEEGTHAYNVPLVFKLRQGMNLSVLKKSLQGIVKRHEILRTLIKEGKQGAYQFVLEKELEVRSRELRDKKALEKVLRKEINHVYNLESEIPIRVCFCKVESDYYISIVIHHIAFDGWSIDIFLRELQEYYHYYNKQSEFNMPMLSIQYKDFALWQRNYLSNERLEKQLAFWKAKLEDYNNLNLITDKQRANKVNYEGEDLYFTVDEETSSALRALARELGTSLYSVLLSAYYLMLRAYSNQDDIVVGSPVANRHYMQIENLIGFFVNTLVHRTIIDPKALVRNFIQKIGRENIEAQLHQDLPFGKLVEELAVEKDISRHPIFQVMFGVQNFGNSPVSTEDILQLCTDFNALYKVAKFDISLFIDDSQKILKGNFNYAICLYTKETIQRFQNTYVTLLNQIGALAGDKEKQACLKVGHLHYITSDQYQKIVYEWNRTDNDNPEQKTIHALFEEQVEKAPKNIAVIYEDCKLTYQELNEKANKLAHYLINTCDIKADMLVGLYLNRSEYLLIAVLAVLKAGGAYVPIDPCSTDEKIRYILKDAGTRVLLTNEQHYVRLAKITDTDVKTLCIDSMALKADLQSQPLINSTTSCMSTSLAYVIYTSGTTGQPKGVMIEHKGVVNLGYDLTKRYTLNKGETVLLLTNYVFDPFIEQIIVALFNGYTVAVVPDRLWENKNDFYQYLNNNKVTHLEATPTFLREYNLKEIKNLRRVIFGGEPLKKSTYEKMMLNNNVETFNVYGTTETSVSSLINLITNDNLSIGTPISNTKAYILNNQLVPLPVGAIGELYLGGVGLARGYLNSIDLTKEKFIINPFQTEQEKKLNKNAWLYKTGDLVRWREEGDIEYIVRNDFQIKIRGHRIELGEIESALCSYQGIRESVVLVKEGNNDNKYLVSYYISQRQQDEEKVLLHLRSTLPEYMVPSILVYLTKFPLTINGKLDRKALPEPHLIDPLTYFPPRNELERELCEIWGKTLDLPPEKISIKGDFFRLGGNSILAITLTTKINQHYQSNLKVSDIFTCSSIETLLPKLLQRKQAYQAIIKLNAAYNKTNLFMIHPGMGGCEVYTSLANVLKSKFSCYGVDSYNLYHEEKIDNLTQLARHYLSYIKRIMDGSQQDTYYFLGWSLGGLIALEMAAVLEQSGCKRINVFLLDTFIYDEKMLSFETNLNLRNRMDKYHRDANLQGIDEIYIQKVISAMEAENKLIRDEISSKLAHTKATLFRAKLIDEEFDTLPHSKAQHHYLDKLQYGNVEKAFKKPSSIKVLYLNNTTHYNIINKHKVLSSVITPNVYMEYVD